MSLESIKAIWPRTSDLMCNIMLVYFFEYNCITCFADRFAHFNELNTPKEHRDDYFVANYYIVLNMSYQLGVFISRSSLNLVKFSNVTILTVLQGLNFLAMLCNLLYMCYAVLSLWVLCPYFIWIGLMGGASYVNCMHSFLERENLRKDEKETAISFALVLVDVGVTSSALFAIFMT